MVTLPARMCHIEAYIQSLTHECPTFWLAFDALSEEKLSWIAYNICIIVKVYKLQISFKGL